ncbi:MAG TPA: hypothetical protein VN736_17135 [Candidatus Limnocylindrales bacterium]|nr:hypothetical protein [Candidatus Limnocylindrales bacterium]
MALPDTIRVKLSSEAAEAIALTPVVVREIPIHELVEHMLGVTGKDESRIREILLRGTLVSGASRFRWTGWQADAEALRLLLESFPDPDPSRTFVASRCIRVLLRGGRQSIEITRDAGTRKGLFQRKTFWDHLMEVADAQGHAYSGYSYRDRADRFTRELTVAEAAQLREGADAVRFTTLRDQIRAVAFTSIELLATRE